MRGLEELPSASKAAIRPIFLFAPWVGSKSLDSTWERIEKSYGSRDYFLDLDDDYSSNATRQAVVDFNYMRSPEGLESYYNAVESHPHAIPVVRFSQDGVISKEYQLERIIGLRRGCLLRITRDRLSTSTMNDLKEIIEWGVGGYVLNIDYCWTNDLNSAELWFANILERLRSWGITVPIILTSTDFPRGFTGYEGVSPVPIGSRIVYANLARRYNSLQLVYGDWATTKPRDDSMGSLPAPRIDYPTGSEWIIVRKPDDWDFPEVAKNLRNSRFWSDEPLIWGKKKIMAASKYGDDGLSTAAQNVAARVNIHLFMQAELSSPLSPGALEEPWPEDL